MRLRRPRMARPKAATTSLPSATVHLSAGAASVRGRDLGDALVCIGGV